MEVGVWTIPLKGIRKSRKYEKERKKNEKKRIFKGKGTRWCFAEYGGTHLYPDTPETEGGGLWVPA